MTDLLFELLASRWGHRLVRIGETSIDIGCSCQWKPPEEIFGYDRKVRLWAEHCIERVHQP